MARTCLWVRCNGINWDTMCGHTYFPYVKGFTQPEITSNAAGDDICPWCGDVIQHDDDTDDE